MLFVYSNKLLHPVLSRSPSHRFSSKDLKGIKSVSSARYPNFSTSNPHRRLN